MKVNAYDVGDWVWVLAPRRESRRDPRYLLLGERGRRLRGVVEKVVFPSHANRGVTYEVRIENGNYLRGLPEEDLERRKVTSSGFRPCANCGSPFHKDCRRANPCGGRYRGMPVRENPMLAIVGNPFHGGVVEAYVPDHAEAFYAREARRITNDKVVHRRRGVVDAYAHSAEQAQALQQLARSLGGGASVLNPGPREVHPMAYEARDRYREDMEAGHSAAAEYWRGQAGAFFTGNPIGSGHWRECPKCGDRYELGVGGTDRGCARCFARSGVPSLLHAISFPRGKTAHAADEPCPYNCSDDVLEGYVFTGRHGDAVVNCYVCGREVPVGRDYPWGGESQVAESAGKRKIKGRKKKAKKKKAAKKSSRRKNPDNKRKPKPRTKKVSLDEAREIFHGFDEAVERYKRFHGNAPEEVEIYYLPDGHDEERVENVHVALHRTIETPYVVPWKSNKKGSVWLHEHPEGKDAPLEVLDPKTGTTRKIGGVYVVEDWWYS